MYTPTYTPTYTRMRIFFLPRLCPQMTGLGGARWSQNAQWPQAQAAQPNPACVYVYVYVCVRVLHFVFARTWRGTLVTK
jgi:hypothetical protein